MENASDALKMAAAVLIFVIALSTAIYGFTKARQAATAILSKSDNLEYYDTENIDVSKNRIVGIETVIPTLYSYFKEGNTILFYTGTLSSNSDRVDNIRPMTLYYSEALPTRLKLSTMRNESDTLHTTSYNDESGNNVTISRAIYGIDSVDEDSRQEPWLHDEVHAKYFIQSLINNTPEISTYDFSRGKFTNSPNSLVNNKLTLRYIYPIATGNLSLAQMTKARFVERVGNYNAVTTVNNQNSTTEADSSVINFSNDETIQNDEGVQKRVVQYIYITN